MILAEFDKPLLEVPAISTHIGRSVGYGQSPYSDWLSWDWKYGDSADSVIAGDRLRKFMMRTGREIHERVLPFDNTEEEDLCDMCHELMDGERRICPRTNVCPKAEWNRNCGHPDTAVVYPGLENLMTVLFMWGVITSEDFAQHSAYMRVLAGKFSQIDLMARWDKVDGTQEWKKEEVEHLLPTFVEVFWVNPTAEDNASSVAEKRVRNKRWQKRLRSKADAYIPIVCAKIQRGLEQNWEPKSDQICRETLKRIDACILETEKNFWTMDFPK